MNCLLLLHETLTRQANVAAKPALRRIATVLAQTASDLRGQSPIAPRGRSRSLTRSSRGYRRLHPQVRRSLRQHRRDPAECWLRCDVCLAGEGLVEQQAGNSWELDRCPTHACSGRRTRRRRNRQVVRRLHVGGRNSGRTKVKEYKVMTQKDRFFGGKFDPEKLEKAMNSYAAEGWAVISVATASIPSLTGSREELV